MREKEIYKRVTERERDREGGGERDGWEGESEGKE